MLSVRHFWRTEQAVFHVKTCTEAHQGSWVSSFGPSGPKSLSSHLFTLLKAYVLLKQIGGKLVRGTSEDSEVTSKRTAHWHYVGYFDSVVIAVVWFCRAEGSSAVRFVHLGRMDREGVFELWFVCFFSPPFFSGLCCLCNQWCCQHDKMAVYCVTVFFSFPRGIYFLLWLKVQMGLFLCHLSACGFYRCLCCFLPQSPISLCSALLPDLHCCDLLYCVVVGMPCVRWTACFSSFPWRGRESSGETVEGFSWPCLNLATGGGTGVFRPLSEQPRAACLFLFALW